MPSHLTWRSPRRFIATVVAALLVAAATLMPAATATAAEIPGAITSVTTDKTSYGYNERIQLSFTWAVPDSAVAGDTFALDLPDELKAKSLATFPLRDAGGAIVAWAEWDGKSVRVTLTDYVDTHDGVGGTGFVTVDWDHAFTPETSQPIVLEFASNPVEVVIGDKPAPPTPCTENCPPPKPPATSRGLGKVGWWADGAYEGTRDETGNIVWRVTLPGNETGFDGPIAVTDTPGAGSVAECSTVEVWTQQTLVSGSASSRVDASRYELSCGPEGFSLSLDRIAAAEFVSIVYRGTITDQLSGRYGNSVRVEIPGAPAAERESVINRTAAGGDGGGTQSVSVGDLVWLDHDRDGMQDAGEPGIPGVVLTLVGPSGPVTDIDGNPVGPVTTDAGGKYRFERLPVLAAGQYYSVTIDADASAEALAGLTPTVPNAGDRAADSSTGSATSQSLTTNGAHDPTLDFGFVTIELPSLALPEDLQPSQPAQLANTGAESAWPFAVIGVALAFLGALLLAARKAQRG